MCSESKGAYQLYGYDKKLKGLHFKEMTVKKGIKFKMSNTLFRVRFAVLCSNVLSVHS